MYGGLEEKLRYLGLFSLEKAEGNLINAYKNLMGGSKWLGPGSFQ